MKTVELTVEDYLYTFYEKVAAQVGRSTEQVMVDALFRFAGEASMGAIGKAHSGGNEFAHIRPCKVVLLASAGTGEL